MGWRLRIALVQVGRLGPRPARVLQGLASRAGDADLYVMPENWVSREPVPLSAYEEAVEDAAEALGGDLLGGIQYVIDDDGRGRRVGLARIGGSTVRVCEKLHPSASVGERGFLAPGRTGSLRVVRVRGAPVGCVACVDVFYPEVVRRLVVGGAEVVVNPASITSDRASMWRAIGLARAVENSVYAVMVNVTGTSYPDGRRTRGGSAAASPLGEYLVVLGPQEAVVPVDLDEDLIREVEGRRRFREDLMAAYSSLYAQL